MSDDFEPIYGPEHWVRCKYNRHQHYEISDYGRVRNTKTGKIVHGYDNHGYDHIGLAADPPPEGCSSFKSVMSKHFLVADHFLKPPQPWQTEINHKDLNKRNNHVSNLEWVTHAENMKHAREHGVTIPSKPVTAIPTNGGKKLWFESQADAAKYFKVASVRDFIRGGYPLGKYWLQCPMAAQQAKKLRPRSLTGSNIAMPVTLINKDTEERLSFTAIHAAAKYLNVHRDVVCRALRKKCPIRDTWYVEPTIKK